MAQQEERSAKLAIDSALSQLGCSINLKEKQREALLLALEQNDVFVSLPTGYGKTIITALLPMAFDYLRNEPQKGSIVVCVSPLIALMIDQKERLNKMGVSTAVFSGTLQKNQLDGNYQIVLLSPETLLRNIEVREMLLSENYRKHISAVVIDECHCIYKW